MKFTQDESALLTLLQRGLPPHEEPYAFAAEKTGLSEERVLSIVRDLKERKIIRNISGIFDGKSLGYTLSLVAFQVRDDKIEDAAEVINSHPGVSHNYLRKHKYNVWFTLAEDSPENFEKSVSAIFSKSGADDFLVLKNEKLFKIGVILETADEKKGENPDELANGKAAGRSLPPLTENLKKTIALLQNDLPVERSPFARLSAESGSDIPAQELLKNFRELLESGIMRRYAAVLKHREAGYVSNAMTAWKADRDFDPEMFRENKAVTHLYFRTIYPGKWEHPLFAMIHARSDSGLQDIVKELSRQSGISDYLVLDSLREFKKTRVKYFSEEFNEWKRLNYD